jgi:N-acetylneuraminate synthase
MPCKQIIKVGNKEIGYDKPCFIIAEAGVNHNGDPDLAKKLIDAAANAHADAVKFQYFHTEETASRETEMATYQKENTGKSESMYQMLKRLELGLDTHQMLKSYAESKGLVFTSTADSPETVKELHDIGLQIFKIGSSDLTTKPFVQKTASFGKPMIVSTGMGTDEEVRETIRWVKQSGNKSLILLHCTTNYPTPFDEVNLNTMKTWIEELDCLIGFSDHTEGDEIAIMARTLGACVIEKHLTLDKTMEGPDHKASIEPKEFKAMIQAIRHVEQAFGSSIKVVNNSEKTIMNQVRRSVVTVRDLPAGHIIKKDDITIKRPGTGIAPKDIELVIGQKLKIPVKKDSVLHYDDLGEKIR